MATSTKSSSSTPLRFVAALLIARLASAEVASDRATVELSENATTTLLANTEEDPPFYEEAQKAYNLIENVLNRKCYDKKETPKGNPQVRGVKYAEGGGGTPASDDAGDDTAGDNVGDNSNDVGDGGAPAPAPFANESASMIQRSSKRSDDPDPGQLSDAADIGDAVDNAPGQDDPDDGGSQVAPAATPADEPSDTGGAAEAGEGWDESNRTSIKDIPEQDSEKGATPVVVAQIVPRSCENNKEILEALRPLVEQRLAEAKEALAAVKEQDAALQAIIEKEKTAAASKKAKLEGMATVIQGVVDKLTAFPSLEAFGKDAPGAIIVDPNPRYHGATGGTGGDAVDTAGDDTGGGAPPATTPEGDDQSADQYEDDSAPGTPAASM